MLLYGCDSVVFSSGDVIYVIWCVKASAKANKVCITICSPCFHFLSTTQHGQTATPILPVNLDDSECCPLG